ncbi:MAG: response regulator transcription factor [Lentisphaerota bacterium]
MIKKTRILVVDDHSIVRPGLAALLATAKDLEICGEAGSYAEGMEALEKLKPDAAIVDITLKDRSGLDLIQDALSRGLNFLPLVLSMHDEATYAEKALRAGARGYVMKENADEVLVEALRKVLQGEIYVSARMSSAMLKQYTQGQEEEDSEHGIESLTEREKEIFEGIGEGLSTRKIAEKFGLSGRTVEVHRAHIKKKLQCEDAAQLFREAVKWVEDKNK